MKGKEKTLHANLLKKYVVREESPIGNVVPAVQDEKYTLVVEDYELEANAQGAG